MIILYMLFSSVVAFGLVYLLELGWVNRPPAIATSWPKPQAMRFLWAGAGMLMLIGNLSLGVMVIAAGLPVCLAHLRLVDRDPAPIVTITRVASFIHETARASFHRFLERTGIRSHR